MFYHVILQTSCNLACKYCDKEDFTPIDPETYDYRVPNKIEYDTEDLNNFVKEEDYITFYGGEPLLAIDKIEEIMTNVTCKGYMIQTNGILLNKLKSENLKRMSTILVSIDGDQEDTDHNRGKGVHSRVMKNISIIREKGFEGELIARMTITRGSNVFKQVKWLVENGFESVHWQLDALFYENEELGWIEEYNSQVSKLIDYWMENIRQGKVLRLYPFIGVMRSLVKNEPSTLRCGSGKTNFTITTRGDIAPCPIMGSMKKYYCGDIKSKITQKMEVSEPCTSCEELDLCGGRCLYANITKLGREKNYQTVCQSVKRLIRSLKREKKRVVKLIADKKIKIEDFEFQKYRGPEIIP